VGADDVDAYLAGLGEPQRRALEQVRRAVLAVVPTAEQGLSYGAPCFTVGSTRVAGLSASARHLSYLPHSGTLLASLADELGSRPWSKGALRFAVDDPLPDALVARLVTARLAEAGLSADGQARTGR
jgi:uncharacterized protein YdhG (YjbR/CyaY superfamily)